METLIKQLTQAFLQCGYRIWLVGGAARSIILRTSVNDWDFATDSPAEDTERILHDQGHQTWAPGRDFGTICTKIDGYEVQITTLRAETYDGVSRNPSVAKADLLADLYRRDFTVNALALSWENDKWVLTYPSAASKDVANEILDTPGDPNQAFRDDPLRLVRAARFVAQLNFHLARRVWKAMNDQAGEINRVSRERITDELDKILSLPDPYPALLLLSGTSVLTFPSPATELISYIPAGFRDARWAYLFRNQRPKYVRPILSDGYRLSNERVRHICATIELQHDWWNTENWDRSKVRAWIHKANKAGVREEAMHLTMAIIVNPADQGFSQFADIDSELFHSQDYDTLDVPLSGFDVQNYLGIGPGPLVGQALAHLQQARYDLGPLSWDEYFIELGKWWRGKA